MEIYYQLQNGRRGALVEAETFEDFAIPNESTGFGTTAVKKLDPVSKQITYRGSMSTSQITSGTRFIPEDAVIMNMVFLPQNGLTIDDITADMFTVVPNGDIPQALRIVYYDAADQVHQSDGVNYLVAGDGFKKGEAKVDKIEWKTKPTKDLYYHQEPLDYTGSVLTVTYDDGSTTEITDLGAQIDAGTITATRKIAHQDDNKVTLTYEGKTVDFDYYTLSSIAESASSTMTKDYIHGDTIHLDGGKITATYTGQVGATKTQDLDLKTNTELSVDRTVADVDNAKIVVTYHGKTVNIPLSVEDPIDHLTITTNPTKMEYSSGETIDRAGGTISVITKSGKTKETVSTNAATVTCDTAKADINAVPADKRKPTADPTILCGPQVITLTYEGKTVSYQVVVNDSIKTVSITTQPTAKNKYGTPSGDLDFGGLVATVTTDSGNSFTVGANSLTINRAGYNPNTTAEQNFTAKYGEIASENYIKISLINYATGITVQFPSTKPEFDYNTPIETVIAGATYTEKFVNNTTGTPKPITTGMVFDYNSTPAKSLLDNTDHKYEETITIKLTTSDNEFDQLPQSATQKIVIKDLPDHISIKYNPSKMSYQFGETFNPAGGMITLTYISGNTKDVSMGATGVTITEIDDNVIDMEPSRESFINGVANKSLKIKYEEGSFSDDVRLLNVLVNDILDHLEKVTDPVLSYTDGGRFDPGTGQFKAIYVSENEDTIDLADANFTYKDTTDRVNVLTGTTAEYTAGNNVTTRDVTASYTVGSVTKTLDYTVTITNAIQSISVSGQKTAYMKGEAFSKATGTVSITRKVASTPASLDLSDAKITVDSSSFDNTQEGSYPITVSYTENGVTKTTTYNVTITDTITNVEKGNDPDKKEYKYDPDATLDLTGATIAVTKNGDTANKQTVNLTDPNEQANLTISGFDPETIGEQTITVKYKDFEPAVEFKIKVKDYVARVDVTPNSVLGSYQKSIEDLISENSIKYTVVYAKGGARTPMDVTKAMVPGYNAEATATQNLKVQYPDIDTNSATYGQKIEGDLEVRFQKEVKAITITAPTEGTYNHGADLDLTGGTITVDYTDGTSDNTIQMTTAMIKESDGTTAVDMTPTSYDGTNKVEKTLKITYSEGSKSKTIDYPITIINDVQSISVSGQKKSYMKGEAFSKATGTVSITRKVASTPASLNLSDAKITVDSSSFNNTQEGSYPITVSYTENGVTKTTTYNAVVTDTITNVEKGNDPDKKEYKYDPDATLDLTGATIAVTKNGDTANKQTVNLTDPNEQANLTISGFDPETIGEQTITVKYKDFEPAVEFKIKVKDYVARVDVTPNSVLGSYQKSIEDLISENSIKYTVVYAKGGARTPMDVTKAMVPDYNAEATATQNLDVNYPDIDANSATHGQTIKGKLTVRFQKEVKAITITAPTEGTYNHGADLDLTGGTITVDYTDGTDDTVEMTTSMIKESDGTTAVDMTPASYDGTNKVEKTLKIKYSEGTKSETIDYPITIINDIQSISVTGQKKSYKIGEAFSKTGGTVSITRKVASTPASLDLDDTKITVDSSSFDNTQEGTYPITVSYTENGVTKTTTYNAVVTDTITNVEKGDDPDKKEYKYDPNATLDLTGATILVTKNDNTANKQTIDLADPDQQGSLTITGFDPETIGEQTISVKYLDFEPAVEFKIKVKDYVARVDVNPASVQGSYQKSIEDLISENSIKYTVVYAKGGARTPMNLTKAMVPDYNAEATTTQNLDVNYPDIDANSATHGQTIKGKLEVRFQKEVKAITITAPTKDTYNHGADLNLAGGTITVDYTDGTSDNTIQMTTAMIKESDGTTEANMSPASYDTTNKVEKTLKITYSEGSKSKTIDYPITIINDIQSISVSGQKTAYMKGEAFSKASGTVTITRKVTSTPASLNLSDTKITVDSSKFDNTQEGSYPITVSYTENGITKTTTYNAVVSDTITNVEKGDDPTKKVYTYDPTATLDLTGATIAVTKNGDTANKETIDLTDPDEQDNLTITGFDPETIGKQTISVKYLDFEPAVEFEITVKDYVTKIEVTPTEITGNVGTEMADLITAKSIQYAIVYAKKGKQTAKPITASMVPGYNKESKQTQNLKVNYVDNDNTSATFGETIPGDLSITLSNPVKSIAITVPTKTSYNHGESLELDTGNIVVTYENNETKNVPLTLAMLKENTNAVTTAKLEPKASEYVNDQVSKTYVITYQEGEKSQTANYTFTIHDVVKGIVLKAPTKDKYEYGETLDLDGGTVQKVMASGNPKTPEDLTSAMLETTFDPTKEGTQTINLRYAGFPESFVVTVSDNVQSIKMENTPQTEYQYGKPLSVTGGSILATKSSGKEVSVPLTLSMVSGYNPNKLGDQTLTVTYQGKKTSYTVTVKDYVTDIVLTRPEKDIYNIGDKTIDLTKGTVAKKMASGTTTTPVALTDSAVSITGFDTSTEGAKTIKVSYAGFSKTFSITVVDKVKEIILKTLPDKKDYNYGEKLDVKGGTIQITKESGSTQVVNLKPEMVQGYNPKKLGKQILNVVYEGTKIGEFEVQVNDAVQGLKITKPNKTKYEYNQSLDLTGAKVSIVMQSGAIQETVDMTASMLSGYDATKVGNQTIKVTYKGLTGSFPVTVVDSVIAINVEKEPNKVTYENGENLDVTGATLRVTRTSGEKVIPITNQMVSGYDANKAGSQLLTVTYEGKTAKLVVMVKEKVEEKPQTPVTPNKPVQKPVKPVAPAKPVVEKPVEQKPVVEEPVKPVVPDKVEEKPVETLGVKEEQKDFPGEIVGGIFALAGILILFVLVLPKRNVKIYVEENGEFKLGGKRRITKRKANIDVDPCLDETTWNHVVKVRLNKTISEKLDGQEVEIKHNGNVEKYKVHYQNEAVEIFLK